MKKVILILCFLMSFSAFSNGNAAAMGEIDLSPEEVAKMLEQMKSTGMISDEQLEQVRTQLKQMDKKELQEKINQGLNDPAVVDKAKQLAPKN